MKQIEQKNRLCILATAVFLFIYAVWRLGWTIPLDKGAVPVVCWIILTVVEFVGLFELTVFIYEYVQKKEVRTPSVDETAFPDVDVFVFTINEPEELLGKTLVAITNLPPRKMMGIESNGMLLSAVHQEEGEEKLNLLMVSPRIPAGAKLY